MPRRTATEEDYRRRLLNIQQLIQAQLDSPLDPAALARAAHFSMHHFHRIFRAQLGESVMQYVRRLRLERAARKLRLGSERILDLALEAGYESHEAFTRAFAERFGRSPSEFRDRPSTRISEWQKTSITRPMPVVTIQDHAALHVAFMRSRGSYAAVGVTWGKLLQWAAAHQRLGAPLYGICPDDPDVTDELLLRFDACIVVEDDFVADQHVSIGEIPAGTYAVAVHHGSYETLHETYLDVIGRWFPTSGYELSADAVVEHYLDDPSCTPAADLRTEVRVRIAD